MLAAGFTLCFMQDCKHFFNGSRTVLLHYTQSSKCFFKKTTFADPESLLLSSHKPWGFSTAELWKKSWHLGQIQWFKLVLSLPFPNLI